MTLIIGHETDDGFIIAADSAASMGNEMQPFNSVRKIGINNGLVIGTSGTLAFNNHAVYRFDAPDYNGDDPLKYLIREFVPALRASMVEHKFIKDDVTITEVGSNNDSWDMIVGIGNRIFTLDGWFSVYDVNRSFNAIGSGEEYAKGALNALKLMKLDDNTEAMKKTFEIASWYDKGVSAPFHAIIKRDGKFEEITL